MTKRLDVDTMSPSEKRSALARLLRRQAATAAAAAGTPSPTVRRWRRTTDFATYRPYQVLRSRIDVVNGWVERYPFFKVHEGRTSDTTRIEGREYVNFSNYNYLGLSGDARVSAAAKEAIDVYGTSPSASRIASGEKSIHRVLEEATAALLGAEAALSFVGGYQTNVSTIGHLFGARDVVLHDELIHNSVLLGARLSGARIRSFRHNDVNDLERHLAACRDEADALLIVTEGVFSMDGDIAPLPALVELKKRYDTFLMVDEAHSIGVLGRTGRGVREHFGIQAGDVDLWMGTLSKSFASCGGYIAGSRALIDYLRYTNPGFVYSVGMSPPLAAAAAEAIRIMLAEPERVRRLHDNAALFFDRARQAGLNVGFAGGAAIVPIVVGSSLRAMKLSDALFRRGINVEPVISPAVRQDEARLRFFLSADHRREQIETTVAIIAEEISRLPARATIYGEALPTLPSLDQASVTAARLTDPGLAHPRNAILLDPATGERERLYDPKKELRNAQVARQLFAAGGVLEAGADVFAGASLRVAGPEALPFVGRWEGPGAYERFASAQRRTRPIRSTHAVYVMAHGDDVVVAGTRVCGVGDTPSTYEEPFVNVLKIDGDRIVDLEEAFDARHAAAALRAVDRLPAELAWDPEGESANVAVVRTMYEDFVRKADIEAFSRRCDDDVVWSIPGPSQLAFTGVWHGPEGVLAFWRDLADLLDIHEFWLDYVIPCGDEVFAIGGLRSTAKTGLSYTDPFLHRLTFQSGRLRTFREYFDARILLAALRPELLE